MDNLNIAYCQRCGKALIAPLKKEDTNGIVINGNLNVLCNGCAKHVIKKVLADLPEDQDDKEE